MKDRDSIFNEIKEYLFSRNNNNSQENNVFAVGNEEITDVCTKYRKLLISFDNVFSVFYTERGKYADEIYKTYQKMLGTIKHEHYV